MSHSLEGRWFTEIFGQEGTVFGLEIKDVLHTEQTEYQYLEVVQTCTFGRLLALDGCIMLTERDHFIYHEMMAHPALLTHQQPKEVAIIGGGDCGVLREVLRHPSVQRCCQIEIDPRVTWAAEQYFPELCDSNGDPRAELMFIDGIAWAATQAPASLDVLIIDSTDPIGPAEGLFSAQFYSDCARALGGDGILVAQSESPLLHSHSLIQEMHDNLRAAGFNSMQTLLFPQPVYPGGWWSCTLASVSQDVTQFRREASNLPTRYYTSAVHQAAMALPRFMLEPHLAPVSS